MIGITLFRHTRIVLMMCAGFALSSCGGSGDSGGRAAPPTASFAVEVCGAEVPEPVRGERACSPLTVSYRVPQ